MRARGRLLVALVLVAALGGAGYWAYQAGFLGGNMGSPSNTFSDTAIVRRGRLEAVVEVLGTLTAEQSAELTFRQLAGYDEIVEVRVAEGDKVAAGDVLAVIDAEPYQQALEKARSDLKAAGERLAATRKPASASDILAADLSVARSRQALVDAQAALASVRQPDLARLDAAVQDAAGQLEIARLVRTLAEHSESAKSLRDLRYAIAWHNRRATELEALVRAGQANLEETQELAAERQAAGDGRSRLALLETGQKLELSLAEREVRAAGNTLATARKALADAQAPAVPASRLALARAELAVREAQVEAQAVQEARTRLDLPPDAVAVRIAEIEVARLRLTLAEAEAVLTGAELRAPFAGTVTAVNVAAGDWASAQDPIVTVASMEHLNVTAELDESNLRDLAVGQSAEVTFESLPGVIYTAKVVSVPLEGVVQQNITYYYVPLQLDSRIEDTLRLGTVATIRIRSGRVSDGLLVPAMAVQYENGATFVLLPDPGHPDAPIRTPVETGISDGAQTQILDGVQEGQAIVVPLQSEAAGQGY